MKIVFQTPSVPSVLGIASEECGDLNHLLDTLDSICQLVRLTMSTPTSPVVSIGVRVRWARAPPPSQHFGKGGWAP